jgi:hypothetical protein
MAGTINPACLTSNQCATTGMFCAVGGSQRCGYCGSNNFVPMPAQIDPATGGTLNDGHAVDFAGFNLTLVAEVCADPSLGTDPGMPQWGGALQVVSWCESCVRNDGTVDPLTGNSLIAGNIAAMGPFDWGALLFATLIAALAVMGELKVLPPPPSPNLLPPLPPPDQFSPPPQRPATRSLGGFVSAWLNEWLRRVQDIEVCNLAITHAGERLSSGYRFALTLLGGVRRWLFLPALILAVPMMVKLKGGDALSVCLNTVAILFLAEIDNAIYKVGFSERVRTRVEEYGRVETSDREAVARVRSKQIHVVLITATVLVFCSGANILFTFLPLVSFWLGGVAEALIAPGADAAEKAREVAKVTGAAVLGVGGLMVLFGLAQSL